MIVDITRVAEMRVLHRTKVSYISPRNSSMRLTSPWEQNYCFPNMAALPKSIPCKGVYDDDVQCAHGWYIAECGSQNNVIRPCGEDAKIQGVSEIDDV